jgi:hypothetical protein
MTDHQYSRDELLELLRFELAFLEDGGYGRSVRAPWRPTTAFRDSPSCLNFDEPTRPHPCSECALMQFVPAERRSDPLPCHQITLNADGETLDSVYMEGSDAELQEKLAAWLRDTIHKLEKRPSAEKFSGVH